MFHLVDQYLENPCTKLQGYCTILREQKQARTYDRYLAIRLLIPLVREICQKACKKNEMWHTRFPKTDRDEMAEYMEKKLRLRRFNYGNPGDKDPSGKD